jgi:hypothetical protein
MLGRKVCHSWQRQSKPYAFEDRRRCCAREGARERRQRRKSIVIETHNGDGAQAACTVNALQRRVVCDLIDLGRDVGGCHDLAVFKLKRPSLPVSPKIST